MPVIFYTDGMTLIRNFGKFFAETIGPYIQAVGNVFNCNRWTLHSGVIPLHYAEVVCRPGWNTGLQLRNVLGGFKDSCKHGTNIFILHRIQSTQHKTTIMFTATCFDSRESYSGYVRTIYVYKVTVRILGTQKGLQSCYITFKQY